MVKLVLASKESSFALVEEAMMFMSETETRELSPVQTTAVKTVAEFLANRKGLTLYLEKADYPTEGYARKLQAEGIGTLVSNES